MPIPGVDGRSAGSWARLLWPLPSASPRLSLLSSAARSTRSTVETERLRVRCSICGRALLLLPAGFAMKRGGFAGTSAAAGRSAEMKESRSFLIRSNASPLPMRLRPEDELNDLLRCSANAHRNSPTFSTTPPKEGSKRVASTDGCIRGVADGRSCVFRVSKFQNATEKLNGG